jgi:hypothetical protein
VQSPGVEVLSDPKRHDGLADYVKGVIGRFRGDARVLAWDLFNEPDNPNPAYRDQESPNKGEMALTLLRKAYVWARESDPVQPITSGLWRGDWGEISQASAINQLMLSESDVISFHSYEPPERVRARIGDLKQYGRPIFLTEYMARPNGSTFEGILPLLKERRIGAYCWGLVAGKTQTNYSWDSWRKVHSAEPEVWFHDVLRADGTPYSRDEIDLLRRLSASS